ncbi:MAG: cation diffusion facilitator family transporter [Bacilli bacterium]|nr:cation diffusion facilitator family transporter [Bacilli bacterium]
MKRDKTIIITSIINITINIILSIFKIILGLIANSISIVTDGINNASDTFTSVIAIIGTKLASKAPDKEHPYGHGRIEYITSLIISAVVLYAGFTALNESIKKVVYPEETTYNLFIIVIIVVSILTKFIISRYVINKGRKAKSTTLLTIGQDAFNDALLTTSVLIGILLDVLLNIKVEAFVGILVSIYIIKSGIGFIKESINNVLGTRIESKLSTDIKRAISNEKDVQGAYDLIITNYGPTNVTGSVHIEVNEDMTATQIDKISRRITKNIYDKYGVLLHTIGIYSVNKNNKEFNEAKKKIKDIVFNHDGVLQIHGLYIDKENKTINIDIVLDFKVKDKESLYITIYNELKELFNNYDINITLDIDISD